MAWIAYKKAYDMVPQSWIIECLDLFGVAENIKWEIFTKNGGKPGMGGGYNGGRGIGNL